MGGELADGEQAGSDEEYATSRRRGRPGRGTGRHRGALWRALHAQPPLRSHVVEPAHFSAASTTPSAAFYPDALHLRSRRYSGRKGRRRPVELDLAATTSTCWRAVLSGASPGTSILAEQIDPKLGLEAAHGWNEQATSRRTPRTAHLCVQAVFVGDADARRGGVVHRALDASACGHRRWLTPGQRTAGIRYDVDASERPSTSSRQPLHDVLLPSQPVGPARRRSHSGMLDHSEPVLRGDGARGPRSATSSIPRAPPSTATRSSYVAPGRLRGLWLTDTSSFRTSTRIPPISIPASRRSATWPQG